MPRGECESWSSNSNSNSGAEYDLCGWLAEGIYHIVFAASHKESQQQVAILRSLPFEYLECGLRVLRVIKLLRHFHHENIISVLDVPRPRNSESCQEVYIVQELMETDMQSLIMDGNQELSDDHCQYFLYQILRALKAIHSAGIVHCNLNPSNLLINTNCDLKVSGFGAARPSTNSDVAKGTSTGPVGSLCYRAPDIMLPPERYTTAVDMWAVGCIFAEMLGRKRLFSGTRHEKQLDQIFDVIGTPYSKDFHKLDKSAQRHILRLPLKSKKSWKGLFPRASDQALDILDRLLSFNPDERISVGMALEHPYLGVYHDSADEPEAHRIPRDYLDFGEPICLSTDKVRSKSVLGDLGTQAN